MRGDVVFRVYGVHAGRSEDQFLGTHHTRAKAEAQAQELAARDMHGENWAARYHNLGFAIRETIVDTNFEIPSLPKPRDKWAAQAIASTGAPDQWPTVEVTIFRREAGGLTPIAAYARNYGMLATFEPFRQGNRELALISRQYTATAVMDLANGEIIAEEPIEDGFCPVGFYVPDWWDVHDGSIIPGSKYWNADEEWPTGNVGFVWGCHWGDDSSWKVQHLDLSRVTDGIITRDARYGYLEIADHGWTPPWRDLERTVDALPSAPPPFLRVTMHAGVANVAIATRAHFNLHSGERTAIDD